LASTMPGTWWDPSLACLISNLHANIYRLP
jgi:hypothetical protein